MRTLWLVALLAAGAWAQSTGGTFGSGGLSGGGSSSSGGGSRGGGSRGGSSSTTKSKPDSLFPAEKKERPPQKSEWELQREAEERARITEKQQRLEAEFLRTHRVAGQPPSLAADPRLREPAWELVLGMRWPHVLFGLALFLGLFSIRFAWSRRPERAFVWNGPRSRGGGAPVAPKVDSRAARGFVLTLGFDWTVRDALQAELKRLSTLPMGNDVDRLLVIFELVKAMKQHVKGIRYAHARDVEGNASTVEQTLYDAQKQLRARYTHETVGQARQLPEVQARPLEGPGLLVLSLLVGSRAAEVPLGPWMPLEQLLDRVGQFTPTPQLFHVVWSPAVDGDRLSSAELEVLYPELEKVGPSRLGRVACGRCNAVYALELEQCPSCGAKEDRSAGKTPAPPCPWCGTAMPAHETKCGHCGAFVEAPQRT